jgi:hypothetical protein
VLGALATLLALLLALLGVVTTAPTASAAEIDAITAVEIAQPFGGVTQGDSIRLDATWAVPDGSQPGDTFRLGLPTSPRVVGFEDAFDLVDPSGEVAGSCTVDENGFVCTLGDYVTTHTGVTGSLYFWAYVSEASAEEELVFTAGDDVEVRVPVPGGVGPGVGDDDVPVPTTPFKHGWYDRQEGVARWDVFVPGQYLTGEDGEPVVLTDTFDPRLTFVEDSLVVRAVPAAQWDGGDVWDDPQLVLDASAYVVEPGPDANQFRLTVPAAHGADHLYVISYATAVPADAQNGERYANSVSGIAGGDLDASAEYTDAGGAANGDAVRTIRLTKQVEGSGAAGVTGPFGFELSCTAEDGSALAAFPRSAEVATGASVVFANVPVGAVCAVSETADGGADGVTFAPAGPITVTAESPPTIEVVATNTFDVHVGGLAVTKHVTGAAAGLVPEAAEYTVAYSYEGADGVTRGGDLTLGDGSTAELGELPAGTVVTLSEAEPAAVDGVTWRAPVFAGKGVDVQPDGTARVTIGDGTTVSVTVTNRAELAPGASAPRAGLAVTGTGLATAAVLASLLVAAGVAVVILRRRAAA